MPDPPFHGPSSAQPVHVICPFLCATWIVNTCFAKYETSCRIADNERSVIRSGDLYQHGSANGNPQTTRFVHAKHEASAVAREHSHLGISAVSLHHELRQHKTFDRECPYLCRLSHIAFSHGSTTQASLPQRTNRFLNRPVAGSAQRYSTRATSSSEGLAQVVDGASACECIRCLAPGAGAAGPLHRRLCVGACPGAALGGR